MQNATVSQELRFSKHFNQSLSHRQRQTVRAHRPSKSLRRSIRTMNDGGHGKAAYRPRVINRESILHVHDYARDHCPLRDYLFVRLPMRAGLRTSEICKLRIEDIDFTSCRFRCLDSKKHRYYPLPLDMHTVDLLHRLAGNENAGYIFKHGKTWTHKKFGEPLRKECVCNTVRKIGERAGVPGLKPRLLRDFFAAWWYYVRKGNLEILRQILRHDSIDMTSQYVRTMVFEEDVEDEYRRIMDESAYDVRKELIK